MTFLFNVSIAFQEMKSELKMKFDGQVTLYRSYRVGDLPDIQIEHCSLIAPLQGLAQVCLLFKCHFGASCFGRNSEEQLDNCFQNCCFVVNHHDVLSKSLFWGTVFLLPLDWCSDERRCLVGCFTWAVEHRGSKISAVVASGFLGLTNKWWFLETLSGKDFLLYDNKTVIFVLSHGCSAVVKVQVKFRG